MLKRFAGGFGLAVGGTLVAATGATQSIAASTLQAAPAWDTATAPLVFTGVTVVDVQNGRRIPRQTVVIAGTRIQALGVTGTVKVPKGARVVDAQGKYLIPGLWDLHVHPDSFADIAYPILIANGVTGVRDPGATTPLAHFNRWKQEIAAGTRVGPRLIVSGQHIDWDQQQGCSSPRFSSFHYPHQVCISTPDEARLVVDFLKMAGADMVKTYRLSRELYFAVAAEARRLKIPFGGHVTAETGASRYPSASGLEASDSGATILDHFSWFNPNVCGDIGSPYPPAVDQEACTAGAQRLRRNNTWVAFGGWRIRFTDRHHLQYVPRSASRNPYAGIVDSPAVREPTSTAEWAKANKVSDAKAKDYLARLRVANMPIVMGTDAFFGERYFPFGFTIPGFSVHDNLASLVVDVGVTPLEALQTATLNPALAFRATDSLGTIAAGKVADVVLLAADPLEDIWNTTQIRAVVANGRYYDRAALDALLREAERAAAARRPPAP